MAHLTAQYPNIVADTSLRLLAEDSPEKTARLIQQIGADRVLFGSNFPVVDQIAYAEAFRALPLGEDELRRVGHDNAARLLGGSTGGLASTAQASPEGRSAVRRSIRIVKVSAFRRPERWGRPQ